MRNPNEIVADALNAIQACPDLQTLEQVKASVSGQKRSADRPAEKPGRDARRRHARLPAPASTKPSRRSRLSLKARREALQQAELDRQLAAETLDVTLPGRGLSRGGLHPVSRTLVAHPGPVPLDRLRGGDRPRDRDRFLQLHRAQHPGRPSGAGDARHLLSAGRRIAAHPHFAGAGALHANPPAAACASLRRDGSIAAIPM